MTRMSFLVAAVTTGVAAVVIAVAAACGGGGGGEKTSTPTAPPATTPSDHETPGAMASPASRAELETAFETARTQLQEVISKAQAGDLEGARDAYKPADDPLHMIEDALQAQGDADLADSMEAKQHDGVEDPLDSGNPDLAAIAQAAQDILPLLDQAATKLDITGPPTAEEVAAALETARTKLQETLSNAQAGDVDGTKEAFEVADEEGLHIIVDALAPVDESLADEIDMLEHEQIEDELDKGSPDLTIVAQGAQQMLTLLDEAAAALGVSQ